MLEVMENNITIYISNLSYPSNCRVSDNTVTEFDPEIPDIPGAIFERSNQLGGQHAWEIIELRNAQTDELHMTAYCQTILDSNFLLNSGNFRM
jgi:hypothetical protein